MYRVRGLIMELCVYTLPSSYGCVSENANVCNKGVLVLANSSDFL